MGVVNDFFTWGHEKFVPKTWCGEDPDHWTWKIVDALWIDCACCFMFRAFVVGAVAGAACTALAGAVVWSLIR